MPENFKHKRPMKEATLSMDVSLPQLLREMLWPGRAGKSQGAPSKRLPPPLALSWFYFLGAQGSYSLWISHSMRDMCCHLWSIFLFLLTNHISTLGCVPNLLPWCGPAPSYRPWTSLLSPKEDCPLCCFLLTALNPASSLLNYVNIKRKDRMSFPENNMFVPINTKSSPKAVWVRSRLFP